MIRTAQLKLKVGHTKNELRKAAAKALHIKENEIADIQIVKKSVDARKKPELYFVYTADVELSGDKNEETVVRRCRNAGVRIVSESPYKMAEPGTEKLKCRPVITGMGPAGLFCGLLLARAGYCPLILERGEAVEDRQKSVERFWTEGMLDVRSNVQFGEGGAGTFSDGKLNTQVKDPAGRNHFVLQTFVEAGAPPDIIYEARPHIGTDILREVVRNMRQEIIRLGGEVRFLSRMTDIFIDKNSVCGIEINGKERIETQVLVLAIGHSARDTFELLSKKPVPMHSKSFAVGLRIEHPQEMINLCQYGRKDAEGLGAASYKLTRKLPGGRGIYSFCMCPGGYVVNASSEEGGLAVNGMSYHKRDSANANSAMIVTVSPEDFKAWGMDGGNEALGGVFFQRELEKAAYLAGEGKVPIQLFGDFKDGRVSTRLGDITPCIKGSYKFADLRGIFPKELGDSLAEGIIGCGSIIPGFDRPDAVLSGVESRTSSPVRIERGDDFQSSLKGLYPCGEGAGYAGGITSAAMDGMKAAEAVIKRYASNYLS